MHGNLILLCQSSNLNKAQSLSFGNPEDPQSCKLFDPDSASALSQVFQ